MDTSWIDLRNDDPAFYKGCMTFIELAKETLKEGKLDSKCKLRKWYSADDVGGHILFNGFHKECRNWIFHHKNDETSSTQGPLSSQETIVGRDDIRGLLNDAFSVSIPPSTSQPQDQSFEEPHLEEEVLGDMHEEDDFPYEEVDTELPSFNTKEEEIKYKRLIKASDEVLYEGCTTFSKLSFLLHLFHLKCMFHWSAESFTKLLELLIDAFPQIMEFPSSYYEGKKVIKDLGLGYEKIDAYPNNCMLYWGDLAEKDECQICHTSRWKATKGKEGDISEKGKEACKKGEPAKVMRCFPLIPKLKRIYMSSKTAKDMRWHKDDRDNDGMLRHPVDALAWKKFDEKYHEFAGDPRSVRLGLASDGFNPYRLMNTNHSTWPVVLIPYNLPPWLCMKPSSFILSLIILGKSGPGIDIDVYLQPLIHELKMLWEGFDTFDAYSGQKFKLRAALHSPISDFPAYAMLSGWSTKGYKACPICTHSTNSYRFGVRESGSEVLKQQEGIIHVYGKTNISSKKSGKKRGRGQVGVSADEVNDGPCEDDVNEVLWSKRSVFFDLEYWEHTLLRHSLDIMHIEKNVCDNLLGTLLDMDKRRDDENARKALKELGIRPHLWLQPHANRVSYMPPTSYTMSLIEKDRFLRVLKKLKVPDGYGSNLYRCVNVKQRKLINMKSHDNHVMMQDILPVALRAAKATKVIDFLDELSYFFKRLCSNVLDPDESDDVQSKVELTLCKMEKEFLPTFFTIMVHLLIHLVEEVKLGGPVHCRWMYPIERLVH
ncbi:uncharacterized protein LOC125491800 [Beta vulgaris subsp. vulgaris]|uniref:uncharacterized protein LOC125491800 n=1 Tax=Beta vulgaris subsp. vulgaris TaxID=3555 RepID=UPI002036751C|nr:uncharacterized protein LOC125491800 [Beta vulgaris subsp. vulgaris]